MCKKHSKRRKDEKDIPTKQQEKESRPWIQKKNEHKKRARYIKEKKGEGAKAFESLMVRKKGRKTKETTEPKKSRWIKKLRHESDEERGEFIVLRYKKGGTESLRLAVIVSGKVGSAVVRNQIKRRLREIFRTKISKIVEPGFLLLIAKRKIVTAEFNILEREILQLIKRISAKHSS